MHNRMPPTVAKRLATALVITISTMQSNSVTHLKVHCAERVFKTQDIRQDDPSLAACAAFRILRHRNARSTR